MLTDDKPLMVAAPGISWFAGMAVEYLSVALLLAFFTLYVGLVYRGLLHRVFTFSVLAVSITYSAVILATEPMVYGRFLPYFNAFMLASAAFIIARLTVRFIKTKPRQLSDMLFLLGFLAVAMVALNDTLYAAIWKGKSLEGDTALKNVIYRLRASLRAAVCASKASAARGTC